ncbi:MAG: gliding motility lipoprotein GldH [Spirosomataceae bacterium]
MTDAVRKDSYRSQPSRPTVWAWLLVLCTVVLWQGCSSDTVFKDNVDFEDAKWFEKNTASFSFEIDDPSASYNIFYNVRNTLEYPYSNLYVTRFLMNSQGKVINTQLDELQLADAKTGKPLGSGIGDIFDHKILALKAYKFSSKGKYTFKIQQYMRQNPLTEVLSMGVSVEKVNGK